MAPIQRHLRIKRNYFELTGDICTLLNTSWLSSPNMKCFAAKLMAGGAIFYNLENGRALFITSVEVYGRTPSVDAHFENPQISFPPNCTRYQNVWSMTNSTSVRAKLIIGTMEFKYLITASIRVDSVYLPEAGPSTRSGLQQNRNDPFFVPTGSNQIQVH